MDNTVTLILLRALHRSANLFLKEGVVAAIRVLEERQQQSVEAGHRPGDGRPPSIVGQTQRTAEFVGGPTPR
jgi:hypothetical protein